MFAVTPQENHETPDERGETLRNVRNHDEAAPNFVNEVQLYFYFRITLSASDIGIRLLSRRQFAVDSGKSQLHFRVPFFIWPSLVW
jgi:hypothetical protein